jgi:hypothetical protein
MQKTCHGENMFHRKQPPRRESAWWEYYRLCGLTEEELQEDEDALGGLVYEGEVGHIKRSIIHRYRFPPQEQAAQRRREGKTC